MDDHGVDINNSAYTASSSIVGISILILNVNSGFPKDVTNKSSLGIFS